MAESVFIDTWGWLTLRDKRESDHPAVVEAYREYVQKGAILLTTDYVLDETITLLFKRLSPEKARQSINLLFKGVEENEIQLEWVTENRFYKGRELRERFQDKPDISFTDLCSMVIMQERKITRIITGDAHFGHVNLGFVIVP